MDTIVNFRDIGGFPTRSGRKVKMDAFFRSGELVNVDDSDRKLLRDTYNIQRIYDFRNSSETKERPDDKISGTTYMNIDILADAQTNAASLDGMNQELADPNEAMLTIYKEMVLSESGRKGYRLFFESFLAHPDEPLLFHCFAGKDRTGIGAALILSALDVDQSYILEDYLRTNTQRKAANDQLLAQYKKAGKTEAELKALSTMLYVKKEYIVQAVNSIVENYGDISAYLQKGLGLPSSIQTEMAKLYTID